MFESQNILSFSQEEPQLPSGFMAASADFRTSLKHAWPSAEAERNVLEAFARYAGVLQEVLESPEISQRAYEHYAEYTRCVQEAFGSATSRQCVLDAFQQYVEVLKQAWADADPEELTPERLIAIAESIKWVSSVTAAISQTHFQTP